MGELILLTERDARFVHEISQEHLDAHLRLRVEVKKHRRALRDSARAIRKALQQGARVEPGARIALLKSERRPGRTVSETIVSKLIVK
jgi:hypothetical protein